MKQRPTMAGLNTFCPNPPNTIFPKTTPTTIPTIAIQKGMVGGSDSVKIRPVTKTADVTGFPRGKVNRASVMIPQTRTEPMSTKDRHPKR
jgi:hypothetical protein